MKKGEMSWILIGMIISIIVLVILIVTISNAFKTSSENMGCNSYGGNCETLEDATTKCVQSQRIFTNDCRLADKKVCCIKQ